MKIKETYIFITFFTDLGNKKQFLVNYKPEDFKWISQSWVKVHVTEDGYFVENNSQRDNLRRITEEEFFVMKTNTEWKMKEGNDA